MSPSDRAANPAAAAAGAKQLLRAHIRADRAAKTDAERRAVAGELAAQSDAVVNSGDVVAVYESYANEPDTHPLRQHLLARGVRLLLPVVNGAALDWTDDDGASHPRGGQRGMPEPSGAVVGQGALGLAAAGCTLILVPALAVDHKGMRLGQGGGYYDRLLSGITELSVPIASLAIVHDEEILEQLSSQAHDESVGGWLTATGHHWVSDPSDRSRGSHH